MKFLCSSCHREHGVSQAELRACREAFVARVPGEAMVAYRAAAESRYRARADAGSRSGEAFIRAVKAGCPDRELSVHVGRPRETPALAAAKRFCHEARDAMWCLTLMGPPGVGKTVAACYVVLDFCRTWPWNQQSTGTNFEPCVYARASELARLSVFTPADKERFATLQSTRLLVLEDAGDEVTDFGRGVLVELLMGRHATRRRTVICGNLQKEGLLRYGKAVADRLKTGLIPDLQSQQSMRQRSDT